MSLISLRRIDDGHLITIEPAGDLPGAAGQGQPAYEAGYRRIAGESEVPPGRARIFETGGAFILVVRAVEKLSAFHADSLMKTERTPHLARAQQFTIEGVTPSAVVQELAPMPVKIEDGWIWVCVEECR